MYLRTIAADRWRVWRMISRSSMSTIAAAVANPARIEWPENTPASRPASDVRAAAHEKIIGQDVTFDYVSGSLKGFPDHVPVTALRAMHSIRGGRSPAPAGPSWSATTACSSLGAFKHSSSPRSRSF